MFALLGCNLIKLSIEFDKIVFMDVFKVWTSSFRFSNRTLFQFLCRLTLTREELGEYEIVIQTQDASRGFAKLENPSNSQVLR